MWQKFSLRARINLLLALVLTLGLAVNIARLVLEAGPRVQAEDQSVIRLAREFIDTIVAGLNEAPDAEARLNQIVHDLNRLRHVSITRQGEAVERSGGSGQPGRQYRCTLAAGMVRHACSPRKDHRERADLDQGKTGFAADHVASERRDGRDLGWNYHPAPDRHGDCDRSLPHYDQGRQPGACADPDAFGSNDENRSRWLRHARETGWPAGTRCHLRQVESPCGHAGQRG